MLIISFSIILNVLIIYFSFMPQALLNSKKIYGSSIIVLLNICLSFDFYHDLIEEDVDWVLREEDKLGVRKDVRVLRT